MSWVNPSTFRVLQHHVTWQPKDHDEWDGASYMCNQYFGVFGEDWACSAYNTEYPRAWFFSREEDAVMFALTWV